MFDDLKVLTNSLAYGADDMDHYMDAGRSYVLTAEQMYNKLSDTSLSVEEWEMFLYEADETARDAEEMFRNARQTLDALSHVLRDLNNELDNSFLM